jgi:hypothetical protein
MILRPVIASYSGGQAIREFLNDARALEMIARVAASPVDAASLDRELLCDLVAMHVLACEGGRVRLDTAVFLEADIHAFEAPVAAFSAALVAQIAGIITEMRAEPPEAVNFLAGVIGIGQSLGRMLNEERLVVDWKNYTGKYAAAKVDFDEVCDAFLATGADLQTKTILKGARYTAVFIGPGGTSYLLRGEGQAEAEYRRRLNLFLTDAYAMLITGERDDPALQRCAEQAGLFRDGRLCAAVITARMVDRYLPLIVQLGQITHGYFLAQLGEIWALLASTTPGRQGAPAENLMLGFWRYLRKGIARRLYASGLFTDDAPERGLITVFYENESEALRRLLG